MNFIIRSIDYKLKVDGFNLKIIFATKNNYTSSLAIIINTIFIIFAPHYSNFQNNDSGFTFLSCLCYNLLLIRFRFALVPYFQF